MYAQEAADVKNGGEGNVKIVINREEKVINHLTKEVNNNLNLMFYDFNDYGQSNKTRLGSQSQQHRVPYLQSSQGAYANGPPVNQQIFNAGVAGVGDRVPSRQNPTRGSRRGLRDS